MICRHLNPTDVTGVPQLALDLLDCCCYYSDQLGRAHTTVCSLKGADAAVTTSADASLHIDTAPLSHRHHDVVGHA